MQSAALRVARVVQCSPPIQRLCIRRLSSNHGSNEWRRAKRLKSLVQQHNQHIEQLPTHIITTTAPPLIPSTTPSPFASSPATSLLPADVSLPHTCLGCGAALQTQYEHEAGYIEQQTIDRYVEQLSSALQPHARPTAQQGEHERNSLAQDDERDSVAAEAAVLDDAGVALEDDRSDVDNADKEHDLVGAENEGKEDEDSEATEEAIQPDTLFSSDTTWQNAWRRGELSEADLQAHNIDVITPKQLKQQLRELRAGRSFSPSASVSTAALLPKPLRCVRCFQLTHYGHTRGNIATAISSDFRQLLQSRFLPSADSPSPPSAVILLLVDILDLHSSLPPYLSSLLGGRNPIILVANKRDLLPQSYGPNRLLAWLKAEGRRYGVHYHSVQLVSAKTGEGIPGLMRKAGELAAREGSLGRRDIYLIGAVNTGKSSLINKLQEMRYVKKGELASSSAVTSSIYPGTTLGLVAFPLIPARDGTIYDTPGVLSHPLSTVLTHDELKAVLPTRPLLPVTYRLREGQSILLGGMARIDHVAGRPFLYTVYVSGGVTIHVTNPAKLDADNGQGMHAFYEKHAGGLVAPPFSYERYVELGLGKGGGMTFELKGRGWEEASDDIVLPGLGWVAVTGAGDVKVRVLVAGIELTQKEKSIESRDAKVGERDQREAREAREERVLPFAREPLMPLDARSSMRKFHGSDTRQNRRMAGTAAKKVQQRGFHTLSAPIRSQSPSIVNLVSAGLRYFSTSFSRSSPASAAAQPASAEHPAPTTSSSSSVSTSPAAASASHAAPSPPSTQPIPPSSSSSSVARRSLSSYGRPQWSVYKQLLVRQSTAIQQAYRGTAEYVRAPKGSWRVQDDGRLVKLFRWRDKWEKGGKFRKKIDARWDKKRQRQQAAVEESSTDAHTH